MKSQLKLKNALLTLLLFVLTTTAFSQESGKVTGKVINSKTNEPIVGLTVKVLGTSRGGSSDVSGIYNIPGLPVGKHTLEFSYVGYSTKQITDVEIKDKEVTTLDVLMDNSEGTMLDQVVVTGSFKKESINALYAQQKNSIAISDGISAEIIKKTPDKNTGEVLKRVSGASVQDNKFIIIRGLSDRYNAALLNNSPLPSTEADRKAFSFDIIPSSLIDNIVISKTATADLPGDLTGGAVNVKTKDFPDRKTIEFNVGLGYNSLSTFKNFLGNKRTTGNYFGALNPENKLPSNFPSSFSDYSKLNSAEKVNFSKEFKNTWVTEKLGKALPTQSAQALFGNTYMLKNEGKLGVIGSISYRNSETISPEIRNDYNSIDQGKDSYIFKYNDTYYRFNSNVGALGNISYLNDNLKLSWKNIFNQGLEQSYTDREGEFDDGGIELRKVTLLETVQKRMFNSVLDGEYLLNNEKQSKLSWNFSYSNVNVDQPDLRRTIYSKKLDPNNPDRPYQISVGTSPSPSGAGRFYSNLNENIYSGGLNWSYGLKLLGQEQTLKVGALKQYKKRNVDARVLAYRDATETFSDQDALLSMTLEDIFSPENMASNRIYLEDITNPDNAYEGTGDLNAGFMMVSGKVAERLKASVGVRYENYKETLLTGALNSGENNNVNNTYNDFLPSLNLTYELNPKTNLRFSYSNTLARAQFRELASFSFYDFVTGITKKGNPDVKRTRISNFDLRYEFYPSLGKLISVSAFYKDLKDPIESNIIAGSSPASKLMSYVNAPKAYIMGGELEVRHDFGFINQDVDFFKNLVFSANAAVIKSEVNFENTQPTMENKRALYGQSPFLLNFGLQYSSAKGWEANAFFNRIGRRIDVVGFGRYESSNFINEYSDIFEAPRSVLDIQVAKKLISNKAELKLNVGNILDTKSIFYQDVDDSGKYNANNDRLMNSVNYGRNFSLSFGYRF